MHPDFVSEKLGVSIVGLLSYKTLRVTDIVPLKKLNNEELDDLLEKVYQALSSHYKKSARVYPHIYTPESFKRRYVLAFFEAVKSFIIEKHACFEDTLIFNTEEQFITNLLGREDQKIKADVSVVLMEPVKMSNAVKRIKVAKPSKTFLSVVECKSMSVDDAVKQCLAYLAAASKANGDNDMIYGLNSDGSTFSLLAYDPTDPEKCDLSPTYSLMFPRMFLEENKEVWKRECSTIPRLVHTIICNKLNI